MAKITITFTCPTCGATFTKSYTRRNRAEAHEFEVWANENITNTTECYDCYKARKDAENAETASKYNLPEITGKSEKQINYANDLRVRYIGENEDYIKRCIKLLETSKTEAFLKKCEAAGFGDEDIKKSIYQHTSEKAYVICTTGSARELIDTLR